MVEFDPGALSTSELLSCFAEILDELKRRGVVRTRNNPVADYTEWLVSERLGLRLMPNSSTGYDALAPDGERVQVKGRRLDPSNPSRQLGVIRNLASREFDSLVGVIFSRNFVVQGAYKIPHGVIEEYARYSQHQNGHILQLRGPVLTAPGVEEVTQILCSD